MQGSNVTELFECFAGNGQSGCLSKLPLCLLSFVAISEGIPQWGAHTNRCGRVLQVVEILSQILSIGIQHSTLWLTTCTALYAEMSVQAGPST